METSQEVIDGVFGHIPGLKSHNGIITGFPHNPTGNTAFEAWKVLYIQTIEYKEGLMKTDPDYPSIDMAIDALFDLGTAKTTAIKAKVRDLKTKYGL